MFRIHHSLGDGVTLLRLFLETIADREPPKKDFWTHCIRVRHELKKYLQTNTSYSQFERKTSIWKSLLTFDPNEFRQLSIRLNDYVKELRNKIMIFITSPASIIYQGAFKKIDENCLHQKKLCGKKVRNEFHFD